VHGSLSNQSSRLMLNVNETLYNLNIQILQGSAATGWRWDGRFKSSFLCSLSLNASVKELLSMPVLFEAVASRVPLGPGIRQLVSKKLESVDEKRMIL